MKKETEGMKRPYRPPELVEYGRIDQLTKGSDGNKPDFIFTGTALNPANSSCSDPGATYGCLVRS
jgi:hypothetical protein